MPTSLNYLCGCGRFMRCKKNSVTVEEVTEDGSPYKLFDADLWECVECGTEIIAGFGKWPLAEHWQPTYAATRERLEPIYVGRCREAERELTADEAAQALGTFVAGKVEGAR